MTDVTELHQVPLDKLVYNDWNPNEMDERTFNLLCQSIDEEGFVEPIQVVPQDDEFLVVGGHHRAEAMKVLGRETIPAVLLPDWDEDRQKINLVKLNILRGELNPTKFTKLYEEMIQKYDNDLLKEMMGFTSEDAFQSLYVEVKSALPKGLQDKLDGVKGEIKTIDDLSTVLNRLFAEYGETLPSNFMVFSFGGKEVLWVRANADLWKLLKREAKACEENGESFDVLVEEALRDQWN